MITPADLKLMGWVALALTTLLGGGVLGYKINSTKVAELKYEYAVKALKKQAVVSAYEKTLQSAANSLEKKYHDSKKKHEQELVYYRNLVKSLGGLHDSERTTSNNGTTGSTGQPTGTTGGAELSAGATEFLLNQANKADQVVDQYLSCQQYLNSLVDQSKKGAQND